MSSLGGNAANGTFDWDLTKLAWMDVKWLVFSRRVALSTPAHLAGCLPVYTYTYTYSIYIYIYM
jgi:hypothetical protein